MAGADVDSILLRSGQIIQVLVRRAKRVRGAPCWYWKP